MVVCNFATMIKLRIIGLLSVVLLLHSTQSTAQINVRDSLAPGWLITIRGGFFMPEMDLKDKYGKSYAVGIGTFYKTKTNWLIGINGDFWFGSEAKDRASILQAIGNENGEVLDHFGNFGNAMTYQRGWLGGFDVGKIFRKTGHNANSGVFATMGLGYMQHRVRVESANRNSLLRQIEGEFQRGYDRLNIGWMSRVNIGYMHSHTGKTMNFMFAFEVMYGETENVRKYNWDTGMEDLKTYRNLTYGFRLTWFLPIYDKNFQTFYYN